MSSSTSSHINCFLLLITLYWMPIIRYMWKSSSNAKCCLCLLFPSVVFQLPVSCHIDFCLCSQGQKLQEKLSRQDQDRTEELKHWPLVLMNKRWQKHSLFTACCVEISHWHTPKLHYFKWIWQMRRYESSCFCFQKVNP